MIRWIRSLLLLGAVASCKDPAAGAPRAVTRAPTRTVAPAGPRPASVETLRITQAHGRIGFVGAKVTGSHEGHFNAFTGAIELSPEGLEASRVTVTIAMDSVEVDNPRLTNHLKSADFFDVARFPQATFGSTEIRRGASGSATHTVTGNLLLHGQTRSITFPATLALAATEVTVAAEFTINRRDFGVNYAGRADDLIRDEVVIRLSLRAPRG